MEEEKLIEGLTEDTSPTADAELNTESSMPEKSDTGLFLCPEAGASVPSSTASGPPSPSGEGLNAPRNWAEEWAELAKEHPEVIGKTLPNDIYEVCINSDRPPLRVYESMMLEKLTGEVARLQKENETLRQNAANSMRAPVTGVAGSGVKNDAEDDFLRGFNNFLNL